MSNGIGKQASGFVVMPRLKFDQLVDKFLYQHFVDDANFKPSQSCEKGQTIVSLSQLSKDSGWTYGVIRGACERLVKRQYITTKTLPQKRGILITITDYDRLQHLVNYQKSNKENNKPITKDEQTENKEDNKEGESSNEGIPMDSEGSDVSINKENNKLLTKDEQTANKEINNTRTAFNNSINIKTYKDLRESCKKELPQVSSSEDAATFVNLLSHLDGLPDIKASWLIRYIDTIRLTRSTCKVSTNVLITFLEKALKFDKDIIHYAFASHIMNHDDKRESYTLGIMRNTNVHEARRKLMKILNNGRGEMNESISTGIPRDREQEHDEYEELYL